MQVSAARSRPTTSASCERAGQVRARFPDGGNPPGSVPTSSFIATGTPRRSSRSPGVEPLLRGEPPRRGRHPGALLGRRSTADSAAQSGFEVELEQRGRR